MSRCAWRVALGDREGQRVEVVLDTTTLDGGRGQAVVVAEPLAEHKMVWAISGPSSQDPRDGLNDRILFGATGKSATAIRIEFDDGSSRDAQMIRCDDAPFDLYLATLDLDEHPVARLRVGEESKRAQRIRLLAV